MSARIAPLCGVRLHGVCSSRACVARPFATAFGQLAGYARAHREKLGRWMLPPLEVPAEERPPEMQVPDFIGPRDRRGVSGATLDLVDVRTRGGVMRGHVRKRGSRWCVVYDEHAGEDGKRRQRWKGGFRTKAEAEDALSDILSRIGRSPTLAADPPAPAESRA
jgi:Arm domain-containing DNA-binding protein